MAGEVRKPPKVCTCRAHVCHKDDGGEATCIQCVYIPSMHQSSRHACRSRCTPDHLWHVYIDQNASINGTVWTHDDHVHVHVYLQPRAQGSEVSTAVSNSDRPVTAAHSTSAME